MVTHVGRGVCISGGPQRAPIWGYPLLTPHSTTKPNLTPSLPLPLAVFCGLYAGLPALDYWPPCSEQTRRADDIGPKERDVRDVGFL